MQPSCETKVYLIHTNIYFWLKKYTVHNFKRPESHCLCMCVMPGSWYGVPSRVTWGHSHLFQWLLALQGTEHVVPFVQLLAPQITVQLCFTRNTIIIIIRDWYSVYTHTGVYRKIFLYSQVKWGQMKSPFLNEKFQFLLLRIKKIVTQFIAFFNFETNIRTVRCRIFHPRFNLAAHLCRIYLRLNESLYFAMNAHD